MRRLLRRIGPFMLSMVVTAAIIIAVFASNVFNRVEDVVADFKMRLRGKLPTGDQVVVVTVDEKSIQNLGRWPWPRSTIGIIIEKLEEYGASVIAFDAVFDTPDINLNVQFVQSLADRFRESSLHDLSGELGDAGGKLATLARQLEGEEARLKALEAAERRSGGAGRTRAEMIGQTRARLAEARDTLAQIGAGTTGASLEQLGEEMEALRFHLTQAEKAANTDAYLADVLSRFDNIVLGYFSYMHPIEVKGVDPKIFDEDLKNIAHSEIKTLRVIPDLDPERRRSANEIPLTMLGLETNLPMFSEHSKYHGYFNVEQDDDGTVRKGVMVMRFRDQWFPSMDLAALSLYKNADVSLTLSRNNFDQYLVESLSVGEQELPVDQQGFLLVNYHDGPNQRAYKYYSASSVVNGFKGSEIDPYEAFKDKIVLFGATAIGVYDLRVTPVAKNYPGVGIHANLLDSLLREDYLVQPDWMGLATVGAIVGFGVILGLALPRLGALAGAGLTLTFMLGYAYFDYNTLFLENSYRTLVVAPLGELLFVYLAVTIYRYATEEREKKFIRDTFGRYLAPAVVDQLMDHPDRLQLGGEELELTAFFSDIEKFSTISEQLGSSQRLVALLNDYLSEMAAIIEGHQGTIDKYEGDAIIAFFGAPLHYDDHAVKACLACIDQQEKMIELRQKWAAEGVWPEIVGRARVRMGVNTGEMTVGNMGSRGRMNYTIMGDAVNLAARLEGANKPYGTYMMISEFTYKSVKDAIECRELDSIRVVGRREPVKIYEILARRGELNQRMKEVVEIFHTGLAEYKKQNWDQAITWFEQAVSIDSGDPPSRTYISRCQDYKINPPGAEWDGVFELVEK